MKQKKLESMVQYGYILSMILFVIFILFGMMLDNEILLWLGVIMLLYIPALMCVYCIQGVNDERKSWENRRKKAKRLAEFTSLRCMSCDRIYKREELDIPVKATPRCPQCNEILIPAD